MELFLLLSYPNNNAECWLLHLHKQKPSFRTLGWHNKSVRMCSCSWQVCSQFLDTECSFWLCFCCRCCKWWATRSVPVGDLREVGDIVWLIIVRFSVLLFFSPCSSVGQALPGKAVWTSHFQLAESGAMGASDRVIKIFEKES